MNIVLCSQEQASATLSHGMILCTQEEADDYLMHYRTKGSKNGERRWQDKDGRLTSEGYQHYAEMYGWGKKLKKAEKLQKNADKSSERAKDASLKSDEAVVNAARAQRKNEQRTTARRAAKLEKANLDVDKSKVDLANANLRAKEAQDKATKYADKLERKENKMLKYVDENGDLTEEAMNKYARATSNPGEKKMSLAGRIKFGNEYSDKFNEQHKMKMTKDEYKEWEKKENEKFDKETGGKEHYRRIEQTDAVKKLAKDPSSFDSLSEKDRKNSGDELLKYLDMNVKQIDADIEDYKKQYKDPWTQYRKETDASHEYDDYNKLQSWLIDRVYDKSGSWNGESFKPGTNAAKVYPKVQNAYKYAWDYQDKVEGDLKIDYKKNGVIAEHKRLWNALKNDSYYTAFDKAVKSAESDLCGAILKDMGFRDTPENRSIIWQFAYVD